MQRMGLPILGRFLFQVLVLELNVQLPFLKFLNVLLVLDMVYNILSLYPLLV